MNSRRSIAIIELSGALGVTNGVTRTLQPTCYPHDCSTVHEDGKLFDGSNCVGKARTRLNFALSWQNEFHLDQSSELPVVSRMTVPLDVPRAASPVRHTTLSEVVSGAVKLTRCGCSERCHTRWQTFRRSCCQTRLPGGNVFGTSGTRLPLRWKTNYRFRCQNKFPVGG